MNEIYHVPPEMLDRIGIQLTKEQYAAVRDKKAWLFVCLDPPGHMIVNHNGEKLHIWYLEGKGFNAGMEFIDRLASACGARKITFGTSRRGWERLAKKYGFHQEQVIYARPVNVI